MNKQLLIGMLGAVALSALPAGAATVFDFAGGLYTTGGTVTDTCPTGSNATCGTGSGSSNSDLSSYAVTPTGQTGTPIVATAYAFYTTSTTGNLVGGSSAGQTSGQTSSTTGALGEYSGAGLGVCENGIDTGTGQNCDSSTPNNVHQVNNAANPNPGCAGTGSNSCATNKTQDYEFILIQFSAAVNLSSIQLGNFGNGGSDPFIASYYTSNSSATNLGTALAGTSLTGLGADGFGGLGATTCTSNCATNDTTTEALAANDVTYLLIGASIANGQAGDDFFKIQDITVSGKYTPPATPEPATFALFGLALTGLGLYGRKRRTNS